MATFKICVFSHQKRSDGRYPISVRVTHNRKSAYIRTGKYAAASQVTPDCKTIMPGGLFRTIDKIVQQYEHIANDLLGGRANNWSVQELCDYLVKYRSGQDDIDFVAFAKGYIERMKSETTNSSYPKLMETTINALEDFFGRDRISISDITAANLTRFTEYMQRERKMLRPDRWGNTIYITRKGVSNRTICDYLTNIRTLFNAAVDYYNDEELAISPIGHYPFKKFRIKAIHESKKRNIPIEDIRKIWLAEPLLNNPRMKRVRLARDVFMLSFCLVGTNLADLYYAETLTNNRLSYNRKKTAGRREDKAFISIKIEPEITTLVQKYRSLSGSSKVFVFSQQYKTHQDFVKNVNIGLKQLSDILGFEEPITSYYARHSWATIARNKCNVSKDDINLALNHVDHDMRVTDIYIEKDWSMIDNANRKVIDLLLGNTKHTNETESL